MAQKDTSNVEFFGNIECNISSDLKIIKVDQLPIINVRIKYKGESPIKISWDDDFGRVLWEGKFVLVSKSDTGKYDTTNLKFKTSNTYPPTKTVELRKGDELTSTLDFSELPISYETGQLIHGGKFSLVLCAKNINEKEPLKQISNELVFNEI